MKFITPIALIGISITLFFVYIDPTYQEAKVVQQQVDEYQTLLNQSKSLIEEQGKLLKVYNDLPKDDVRKLEKLLPSA
ncbi:hypothetical protein IT397_01650, partial [Candidatus Nomurabacteria bacterium]|nr:hypothetical protein [Candidatus Nomurabacteria bacterium]